MCVAQPKLPITQFNPVEQSAKCLMSQCIYCALKGIRVNSVNPGVIDTDFFVNSGLSEKASDNFVKEKSKKIHALGM